MDPREAARIAREIESLQAKQRGHLESLGRLSAEDAHQRESLAVTKGVVKPQPDERYQPPTFLKKAIPGSLLEELRELLAELRARNLASVGMPVAEVEVLWTTDPEHWTEVDRWVDWGVRFAEHRLSRPRHRDRGSLVSTYRRLYDELLPWLDEVAYGPHGTGQRTSIHYLILTGVVEALPYRLWRGTWAEHLSVLPDGSGAYLQGNLTDDELAYCRHMLDLYRWHTADGLQVVCDRTPLPTSPIPADIAGVLAEMADDIATVRPFLTGAVRPERFVLQLADDLWMAPRWVLLRGHVSLSFAPSERELLTGISRLHDWHTLMVDHDGQLRHPVIPQVALSQDDPPARWHAALVIVGALHQKLMDAFDAIDPTTFRRPTATTDDDGADDDTQLAVANAALAQRETGEPTEELGSVSRASARLSPRVSTLVAQLQRHFDVEVRQGKGSELSLYRPGERIFTMGRHKRNPRVRWDYVRRMLRTLGIPVQEWIEAVS